MKNYEYHYVYKTINLINGKFYIGRRSTNKKINLDSYFGSGKILKRAIKKNGEENFKKEIIEQCFDFETLCEREEYWIKKTKAVEKGYNITKKSNGGDTFTNNPNKEKIRVKISEGNTGKIISEEHKKKISEANSNKLFSKESILKMSKAKSGENNPNFGKTGEEAPNFGNFHSQEAKEKNRKAHLNLPILKCPHCDEVGNNIFIKRWHLNNCKQNPEYKSKEKLKYKRIICPWCDKEGGVNNMSKHHFDNCKKHPDYKIENYLIICPHCNKSSTNKGNMKRWHFDNCKLKK